MDRTPNGQRKISLSLSSRISRKRPVSPQRRPRIAQPCAGTNPANLSEMARSACAVSICSDVGIVCTPPHKKSFSLDDSIDYSPKTFDCSYSPSSFLSQTLALDSPEVGWRWTRPSVSVADTFEEADRTPDSAYAADSSFTSAGSGHTETAKTVCSRGEAHRQHVSYNLRREEQRKLVERELRRVEKSRVDQELKQRCDKLQKQLNRSALQKSQERLSKKPEQAGTSAQVPNNCRRDEEAPSFSGALGGCNKKIDFFSFEPSVECVTDRKKQPADTLNDFFNDSDSDGLLLQATQDLESKMEEVMQQSGSTSSDPQLTNCAPSASSPSLSSRDKRSSFYMKFLEDDCLDDWFVSLDEADLQAAHSKKARTSLQRYKSMPADAVSKANGRSGESNGLRSGCKLTNNKGAPTSSCGDHNTAVATPCGISKMKRHSSTHTLSPSSSSYRGRQLHLAK